jgi:hypothetical protein
MLRDGLVVVLQPVDVQLESVRVDVDGELPVTSRNWTRGRDAAYAWPMRLAIVASLFVIVGCGGAPPPEVAHAPVAHAPPVSEVHVATASVIQRPALDEVLEAGLGAFLGRVTTEPCLEGSRFVGFRIAALRDVSLFEGVDLQVGDVLVSVNGQPIERPEQAFTAWTSLRVASELSLGLLRDGERHDLRIPIVDGSAAEVLVAAPETDRHVVTAQVSTGGVH